jgi:hypothetical protein
LNSIPVNYGTSEVLKASATFNFDRYVAGKVDSFSAFNGTANNLNFNLPNFNFGNNETSSTGRPVRGATGVVFAPPNQTVAETVNRNNFTDAAGNPVVNGY